MWLKAFTVGLILMCLTIAACRNTEIIAEQKPQEAQSKKETANVSQTKTPEADELREINYDSTNRILSAVGELTEEQSQKLSKLFNQMLVEKVTKKCLHEREGLEKERIRETISVLEIDLNDDGLNDYVVSNSTCGGSANFPTFVYQSEKNKNYKSTYLGDINDLEVTKHKTNSFYDLITSVSSGANIKEITIYKYYNGEYERVNCGIAKTVRTVDDKDKRQITLEKCFTSN